MFPRLRLLALVLGSCLAVLVLPSTAWATPTSPPSWLTVTNYVETPSAISFDLRAADGYGIGGFSGPLAGSCKTSTGTETVGSSTQTNVVTAGAPGGYKSFHHAMTCPAGSTFQSGVDLMSFVQWPGGSSPTWKFGIGSVPPPPPTGVECDSFRSVRFPFVQGTLDVSWGWQGTVPSRGWRITDARADVPKGGGTQLGTVPAAPLVAGGARYGVTNWPIPAGVGTLRVESVNAPGCFFGLTVSRDASGNVTGVSLGGNTPPDTSPEPDPGTDESGASCGMLDFVCVFKWLFVPDPSSWDLAGLQESFTTRPPFSIMVQAFDTVAEVGGAFLNPACNMHPTSFFVGNDSEGQSGGTEFDCNGQTRMPLLWGIVQACLIGLTMLGIGKMLAGAFDK
ncbi:hypothetical protein [Nocardioides sp. HB32]